MNRRIEDALDDDEDQGRCLVALFAVLYYAGVRPAETVALWEKDCQLTDKGWGKLVLAKTLPVTVKKWTDDGTRHDARGLKQRNANAARIVPKPPQLAAILRAYLDEFGTAKHGHLFGDERGGSLAQLRFPGPGRKPGKSP